MLLASGKRNRRKTPPTESRDWFAWLRPLVAGGLRNALTAAAFIAGLSVMAWGVLHALDQPIGNVEVVGRFQRVAPVQIEQAVGPFRGSGFLSVDLDAMRAALETIPWVDRARAERRWPNGVRVSLTEHVPAARWGEDGLMNTRGELFLEGARHVPPELPVLNGPPGTHAQVAKLYLDTYPRLLAVGLRLARVELDPRGAWSLELSNGVEVRLGRQDVDRRLERFIRVASPLIAARAGEVSYVDLRYSNGFSVGWNAPARMARGGEGARPDA
jgi:cell division protein FtsQ